MLVVIKKKENKAVKFSEQSDVAFRSGTFLSL